VQETIVTIVTIVTSQGVWDYTEACPIVIGNSDGSQYFFLKWNRITQNGVGQFLTFHDMCILASSASKWMKTGSIVKQLEWGQIKITLAIECWLLNADYWMLPWATSKITTVWHSSFNIHNH